MRLHGVVSLMPAVTRCSQVASFRIDKARAAKNVVNTWNKRCESQ